MNILNLAALGLVVWGTNNEADLGLHGAHLVALVLLVVAAGSWAGWTAGRSAGVTQGAVPVFLTMALAGGALVVFAPVALVFPAVAALGATMAVPLPRALPVAVAGGLSMVISVAAAGRGFGVVSSGLAAIFVGTVMGIGRRQGMDQARQEALIGVEKERAELERSRAQLLDERNHLARELHDVLAHTLAALSLQVEAFGTVVESDPGSSREVRLGIERLRTLVHEGMTEARGAVRALREDTPPLVDQLGRLCDEQHVELSVRGTPPPLEPQTSLSLYRIAQESITNAMKHAPGAAVSVCLRFDADGVHLDVENGSPTGLASALGASGSGYGLQGIAERLALVGGRLEAGPTGGGWRVSAEVPVPA